MTASAQAKVKTRAEVAEVCAALRAAGKSVCYTSGVFDLLHRGHVEYLELAKLKAQVLIVGINSDSSVKENKGDSRPICSETDRAAVVAALSCVDYVFIFSEKNNNENIKILKPDIYLKAGDYSKDKLSSAGLVESYGGKVEFVPFVSGYSTTSLIDRVLDVYGGAVAAYEKLPIPEKRPAVFLDRDGTINEHVEYLGDPQKFKLIPGAIEAIKGFNELGYRVVIVTNQPGIGLGYFTIEDFYKVSRELLRAAGKAGALLDKIYFCPHSFAESCKCRKPAGGMIERAVKELNVDLAKSVVIGDTTLDIQLAKNAGCQSILVKTGIAGKDGTYQIIPDHEVKDLMAAYRLLGKSKSA